MATYLERRDAPMMPATGMRVMQPHTAVPPAPTFGYTPPAAPTFTGTAPTASPYGTFSAPPPGLSDYGRVRIDQGSKALQRGAAARGTLLTGGLQARLQELAQGIASEEAGKDFERALAGYTTNRDTHNLNFGNQMATFRGGLDAFGANTGAALNFGRLGLDAATGGYDRGYQAYRDALGDQERAQDRTAADDYARMVAQARMPQGAAPMPQTYPTGRPSLGVPGFASPWAMKRFGR